LNTEPMKLYIFYCANSFDVDEFNRLFPFEKGDEYKLLSLPCSGKADFLYLVKAFESGADGLVLVTCPKDKCRYLEGNLRAPRRAEEVGSLLEEIGMDGGQIISISMSDKGMDNVVSMISEFRGKIKNNISIASGINSRVPVKAS
jgi:F420-non-reducing hydrogenase iron-sulfur subunit